MHVIGIPTKWEDFLHLVEFSFNNSYQDFTKLSPFKEFYGRKFHTPSI